MRAIDALRTQFQKTDRAIEKATHSVIDLAADALSVDTELVIKLGAVGKKLREAHEEWEKLTSEYF